MSGCATRERRLWEGAERAGLTCGACGALLGRDSCPDCHGYGRRRGNDRRWNGRPIWLGPTRPKEPSPWQENAVRALEDLC